jgi:hypothetical protein
MWLSSCLFRLVVWQKFTDVFRGASCLHRQGIIVLLLGCTAQQPWSRRLSYLPPWEPEISRIQCASVDNVERNVACSNSTLFVTVVLTIGSFVLDRPRMAYKMPVYALRGSLTRTLAYQFLSVAVTTRLASFRSCRSGKLGLLRLQSIVLL